MIIEISGLPEGQKIKHINVDIQFEDDGSAVVKTKATPSHKEPLSVDTKSVLGVSDDFGISDEIIPDMPNIEEKREKKDIPPEMTDMEF